MKISTKNRLSKFFNANKALCPKAIVVLICATLVNIGEISAQEVVLNDPYSENYKYVENITASKNDEKVLKVTRTAAIFNGGNEFKNLDHFISTHLVFPAEAIGTGMYGLVDVRFEILKDGGIGKMVILESPGKAFDTAVANLLAKMPAWTPAFENGEPKTSVYQLKLNFRLQ